MINSWQEACLVYSKAKKAWENHCDKIDLAKKKAAAKWAEDEEKALTTYRKARESYNKFKESA